MDNVTLVTVITFIGAMMGTFIPYAIKAIKDPIIEFDYNYAYALIIGIIVQVIALIPDDVPTMELKIAANAFITGYGLQAMLNKLVPRQ